MALVQFKRRLTNVGVDNFANFSDSNRQTPRVLTVASKTVHCVYFH